MQIDPNTVTWDAPPQPVPPPQGQRQGGVIITDPTVAQEQARDDRAEDRQNRAEGRQAAADTWTVMTAAEVAQAGLDPGVVWQRNGLGEMKAVPGQREAQAEKGGDRVTKLETLLDQLDRVESLYQQNLKGGMPGPIAGRVPGVLRPENDQFNSAAAALAEQGLSAFRVPGVGSQSDAELRQFVEANRPRSADTDLAIEEKLRALRMRAEAEFQSMRGSQPEAPPSPLRGTGEPQEEISGEEEMFLTDQDRELQSKLRAAYSAGASLSELQAIAAEYGRVFPVSSQAELDKIRKSGGTVSVDPTGRRDAAMRQLGDAAESELGAYTIGAANALTSGLMDEIIGAFGGDAETAQAAKDYLRDKYPTSSLVGEVTGAAGQMVAGGTAARAVGAGAKALAGVEVAQGAAYGAGEENENRVAGALTGAAGTIAGQQIAKRLLEPGVKAAISRVAAERNIPEEVIADVAAEALQQASGPLEEATQAEVGAIARRAVSAGPGAKSARQQLAIMAQINPEAEAAARRLGIELPLDILSDDAQLKTLTGLARSQIGSEAGAAWGQTVTNAIRQSDEALEAIGASPDLAQVGSDVMERLTKGVDSLEKEAGALRDTVDAAINIRDRVEAPNIRAAITGIVDDLGGGAAGRAALSAEEKKLLDMFGPKGDRLPTYALLNQMRDQIGKALFKGQGPWADTAQANLARYYGALADDQLEHVRLKGGSDLADTMRQSNTLFKEMYDKRRAMQSVFGAKLEKDLPPLINRAVAGAQKGDAQALRKLMESVPEDMRGQVLLSGIMANSTRRSAQGGFSFAQYAQMYRGLRNNAPIYKEIADTIGPEASQVLNDLYAVSRRMAEGEGKIIRTGASTQPLLSALNAENLIAKLMKGTARRMAVTGGTAAVGGVAGGPAGAAAGAALSEAAQEALEQGGKSRLEKLHRLLSSGEFRDLAARIGEQKPTEGALSRLAGSKEWNTFAARVLGLKTPEQRRTWLREAINATGTVTGTKIVPGEQDTTMIEVR